jgi:deazaflavin-dependent oxidoreductase (nitroreductase family)
MPRNAAEIEQRLLDQRVKDEQTIADHRANGGRPSDGSEPLVIITTIGAKTGRSHAKPVCLKVDGDDLIIAATAGGQPSHTQWYRNLVAHPGLTVEYLGETYEAEAETVINSLDRNRLFEMMSEVIPGIYRYQDRCRDQRQIPIVRLRRV